MNRMYNYRIGYIYLYIFRTILLPEMEPLFASPNAMECVNMMFTTMQQRKNIMVVKFYTVGRALFSLLLFYHVTCLYHVIQR